MALDGGSGSLRVSADAIDQLIDATDQRRGAGRVDRLTAEVQ